MTLNHLASWLKVHYTLIHSDTLYAMQLIVAVGRLVMQQEFVLYQFHPMQDYRVPATPQVNIWGACYLCLHKQEVHLTLLLPACS